MDKIGSVEPVKDFKAMIARRDEAKIIERAIHEMAAMIMVYTQSHVLSFLYKYMC